MSPLSAPEIQALHDALDDEYCAWSTYSQVLEDFGPVRPFLNIRDSEQRHIQALQRLFQRHNVSIPANPWGTATVPRFSSLQQACQAGVQAEIDNVELYRRILGATRSHDLLQVFQRLQGASQERHLPAFQRAASRLGGVTAGPAACADDWGRGAGRRRRHDPGAPERQDHHQARCSWHQP